jgi:small conductance mechanosensitive channel
LSIIGPLSDLGDWILSNLNNIIFSFFTIIVVYAVYKIISRQILRLKDKGTLETHLAFTLNRIVKWISVLLVVSAILGQFGVTLVVISGFVAIVGGTVLGFASVNTLGNALAGLIVMISKPFRAGDRIYFKGQFADIESIELIYSKMRTLDNVLIFLPNQELLKSEIENFGRKRTIRRQVKVTPGYNYDRLYVKKALLEAADNVPRILKEPKPYVRITNFRDYAIEYTLYVFINDVQNMREIDSELYDQVFETCKKREIDLRTPLLHQQAS